MKGQKGLTLLEVVMAVAVFGIIAAGLFMALNVSLKATATTDRLTIAESLTRSELEYIKACDYVYWQYVDETSTPPDYGNATLRPVDGFPGYYIRSIAVPIDPVTHELLFAPEPPHDPLVEPPQQDQGIQKVTVEVYFEGELIVTTVDYKVDR